MILPLIPNYPLYISRTRFLVVMFSVTSILIAAVQLATVGSLLDSAESDVVLFWIISAVLSLSVFISSEDRQLLSPVGFFLLSIFIFIFARSVIFLIYGTEMVEAGYRSDKIYEVKALYLSLLYFSAMVLFYALVPIPKRILSRVFYLFGRQCQVRQSFVPLFFLLAANVFLGMFLYRSTLIIDVISTSSYLEVAGTAATSSHIKYFFYGKWLILLYLIVARDPLRFVIGSAILFLASIGFLFIGLRGYSVAYFFLFIFFFNARWKIQPALIIGLAAGLILVASSVMEYRLGYKLYDGFTDTIVSTLHQQGATFEVLYGSYMYGDAVSQCVGERGYFSELTDFGTCVDTSRGVFWEYGGFATSFFGELSYFNSFASFILLFVFCAVLKFLDHLSFLYTAAKHPLPRAAPGFVLFSILPNLVYFARSDVFDLVGKSFSVLFLIFACIIFFSFLRVSAAR